MDRIKFYLKYAIAVFVFLVSGLPVRSQNTSDTLSLSKIIKTIVENHPSVKEALEAINSANAGIGLAKSGYFPTIDATASYARIGPVQELTFPGFGTFQLYPADNYSANLNYYQTVFDFGKTMKNVALAKEIKNLNQQTLEQVKQKLAYTAVMIYYSVVYLQQAIAINKEHMSTLKDHLDFIEKKNETGSATQYEILATKVKISNIESIGIDLQASLKNQITELNELMVQPANKVFAVKEELDVAHPDMPYDSLLTFAYENRDELKIAQKKTEISRLKYKVIKAQDYPNLNIQLSGGAKNGYIPDLKILKFNFMAGAGLKIPVFNGLRTKNNLIQARSAIKMNEFQTELTKSSINTSISESEENLKASLKKTEHFRLQLNLSKEAYRLAQTNYEAGTTTNLDLLDATMAVSESQLLLLKARIEYVTNIYKLKLFLGERLY